jgi:UDP-N-acetyl-D-glucosamine dehydrogenase
MDGPLDRPTNTFTGVTMGGESVAVAAPSFDEAVGARTAKIGIIGLGYAGLPLATGFAGAGFEVLGIDLDPDRVASVNAGRSYLTDLSDSELAALDGRVSAATTYDRVGEVAAFIICVPTPLSKTRTPDLSYVVAAVESVARRLVPGQLVILQSTTVPGTTDELVVSTLERATGGTVGRDFFVGYAPERVDPANTAGWNLHTTPKLVSGVTEECARRTALLFEQVCETVIPCGSTRVAELAKLYENTFRQVNIALANELTLMCQRLGVSAWEVIDAAATKPFGFLAHYPGPGLGGDCIPVVPHFLSYRLRECGYQTRMIDAAHEINTAMPEFVVELVTRALNDRGMAVRDARILLCGVAYKPNVSDLRESPALVIFEQLQRRGAQIAYSDPHVASVTVGDYVYGSTPWEAAIVRRADVVVMLTPHDEFLAAPHWESATTVVDTRNVVASGEGVYRL